MNSDLGLCSDMFRQSRVAVILGFDAGPKGSSCKIHCNQGGILHISRVLPDIKRLTVADRVLYRCCLKEPEGRNIQWPNKSPLGFIEKD